MSYGRRRPDLECPYCGEPVLVRDPKCPNCRRSLKNTELEDAETRLKKQRFLFNLLSFALGIPGLGLIMIGGIVSGIEEAPHEIKVIAFCGGLLGAILLCVGVGFATAYKRDNAAWAILAAFGIIGLLVVAVLED